MASNSTGEIASLWRYPVKSMMGEELRSTTVTDNGIFGDRSFALIDVETGKVASAKNPKRWPNMFSFHARFQQSPGMSLDATPARITMANGSTASSDDADINAKLSKALGREVKLISQVPSNPQLEEYWPDIEELDYKDVVTDEDMPAGTFFDLAVVHILTTSTLAQLNQLYPEGRFEARRFRPNIVVNTQENGFVENQWIGHTLAFGDQVLLKITGPCPRCVMTTLPQGDLPRDTKILRTAAQHNNAHVGVYAEVVQSGTIRCGDTLSFVE